MWLFWDRLGDETAVGGKGRERVSARESLRARGEARGARSLGSGTVLARRRRRPRPGRTVVVVAWMAMIAFTFTFMGRTDRVARGEERVPRIPMGVYQRFMPPPIPPGPPPPIVGPQVFFNADESGARLQQLDPSHRWQNVCATPCGLVLDGGAVFRVGGGDTRPSAAFSLPRSTGEVSIAAAVGSKAKHYTGLGLMIGGGVAMAYGGAYWAFFHDVRKSGVDDPQVQNVSRSYETLGLVALGVGLVMVIAGIPLWFSNTTVEVR